MIQSCCLDRTARRPGRVLQLLHSGGPPSRSLGQRDRQPGAGDDWGGNRRLGPPAAPQLEELDRFRRGGRRRGIIRRLHFRVHESPTVSGLGARSRLDGPTPRAPRPDGKNDVAGRFSRRARAGRVLPRILVTFLPFRAAGPAVTPRRHQRLRRGRRGFGRHHRGKCSPRGGSRSGFSDPLRCSAGSHPSVGAGA